MRKPIEGFDGYLVDDEGTIWTCWHRGFGAKLGPIFHPQPLKANWTGPKDNPNGYLSVTLSRRGQKVPMQIHTAVCTAFNGPRPFPDAQVRHLDGDTANNRASNLVWGTCQENHDDSVRHGTRIRGEAHPQAKLTEAQVREIRASSLKASELAQLYGVDNLHIYSILSGRSWRHVQ